MNRYIELTMNGKQVDKQFIIKYTIDYVEKNGLETLVNGIKVIDDTDKLAGSFIAGYAEKSQYIIVNMDKIIQQINKQKYDPQRANAFILEVLNHELTHVKQKAIVKGLRHAKEEIKKELYKNTEVLDKHYEVYMKNSQKFLIEYNAIIESKIETMKILEKTELPNDKRLLQDIKNFLYFKYNNTNPKKEFDKILKENGIKPCKKQILSDLTEKEKALYGYKTKELDRIMK